MSVIHPRRGFLCVCEQNRERAGILPRVLFTMSFGIMYWFYHVRAVWPLFHLLISANRPHLKRLFGGLKELVHVKSLAGPVNFFCNCSFSLGKRLIPATASSPSSASEVSS